ncbi:unnamed protein product [Heligmosomoides polygyrus]|uniref:Uncharacterized protein n=1 Tax=Heligmosomoides polygyrus TaxID=6339 RepID=A0A183FLB5_HELPZ|nr:unnamed protein product [Heligmosomoides polygyrus]
MGSGAEKVTVDRLARNIVEKKPLQSAIRSGVAESSAAIGSSGRVPWIQRPESKTIGQEVRCSSMFGASLRMDSYYPMRHFELLCQLTCRLPTIGTKKVE